MLYICPLIDGTNTSIQILNQAECGDHGIVHWWGLALRSVVVEGRKSKDQAQVKLVSGTDLNGNLIHACACDHDTGARR